MTRVTTKLSVINKLSPGLTPLLQEMAKAKAMINQQYPGMYRFG